MKSNKPVNKKRKAPKSKGSNHGEECEMILKKVGKELHTIFSAMCQNNPMQFLVAIMYSPHHFKHNYMAWKFACKLTPQEHIELDMTMSTYTDTMDALEHLLEWAILHKKTTTQAVMKNLHIKTFIEGGQTGKINKLSKSRISNMNKQLKLLEVYKRYLKDPGQEGFNKWYSSKLLKSNIMKKIKAQPFECGKDGKYWRYQPYQLSAMYLGSKKAQTINNLLIVAPTGSGKTAVIQNIISSHMPDDRVKVFATPSVEVQRNFFSQITEFNTQLSKYVQKYPGISREKLLSFHPEGAEKFNINKYRNYLEEVRDRGIKGPERRKLASKKFGSQPWEPHAPIRSVLFKSLLKTFQPCDSAESFQKFVHNVKNKLPCVKPPTSLTGTHRLTTFQKAYAWDRQEMATSKDGLVRNPFNRKIIVLDEADQLFSEKDIAHRMLVLLLKYAQHSIIIALTATPLIKGDEDFSDHTCRLLEMIKGRRALESNPFASTVGPTCSNEGFISYFNAMIPPLYPVTKPFIGNMHGKPVLGRIIFAELHKDNRSRYLQEAKVFQGRHPNRLLRKEYVNKMLAYASSKYTDRYANNKKAVQSMVKDFEKVSSKSSCLFRTLMQHKDLKTLVLFTEGLKTFQNYIKVSHRDMYFDLAKNQEAFQIGFIRASADKTDQALNSRKLKAFNSSHNLRGERMRIICADRSFFVGVNFKNVRRIIMVSPSISSAMYIQTVGRVLRMCTYEVLPENERNVQVDIMVATLDRDRRLHDLTDKARFDQLVQEHMSSKKPLLTIDEVALHHLYRDVQHYRVRMDTIFAEPAVDRGWYTIPTYQNSSQDEELEARCTSQGVGTSDSPYAHGDDEDKASPEQHIYNRGSHIHTSTKPNKAIGRQDDKAMRNKSKPVGIGISKIKDQPEYVKPLPKPLPMLDDLAELKLAKTKFRNLSFPSISEAEFNTYKQYLNIPVQTFVYESRNDLDEIKSTMSTYNNALMLARDKYPVIEQFGEGNNFHIQVLLAQAAKKWSELQKFYNKNFVGGSMKPWTRVIGVNLYYLKFKNRVYIQYEPNVRVVRPVLFVNLKAWRESLGDRTLTEVDYHEIYQAMTEFRKPSDRVRYKDNQKMKVNADGTVDVVVEIKVPTLAGFNDEVSPKEALSQPMSYNAIVNIYSEILSANLNVPMEQIRGHKDGKGHVVFHVYKVAQQVLDEPGLESNLNLQLLDPDPKQNLLIPVKRMDGHTEEYVLKVRQGVDSSTITNYIRYAVGAQLPKRKSAQDVYTSKDYYKNLFKRGINAYPSPKEILNNHNGNVWILVGSSSKFRIFATKVPLPTTTTVDAYRDVPEYQQAKNENKSFVLLNKLVNQPWQMAVTRPYASIRQFALHASDDEYNKFWKACLEVKHKFEEKRGTTLYMYTDSDPSLALFHVKFAITRPPMPSEEPRVQPSQPSMPSKPVPPPNVSSQASSNMEQQKQANQEVKKQVNFASKPKMAMVQKQHCAKQGDELYLLLMKISDLNVAQYMTKFVVQKDAQGVYSLPHKTWDKFKVPSNPLINLEGVELSEDEEVDANLKRLMHSLNVSSTPGKMDDMQYMDLSDGSKCVRVAVRYETVLDKLPNHVELVSKDQFLMLTKVDDVLKGVQMNMKHFLDTYLSRLENA
jgi:superfamily II DNA or RNA helicase